MYNYKIIKLIIVILALTTTLQAQLWLPSFFSNNMVLQHSTKNKLFGKGIPNEKIQVTLSNKFYLTNVLQDSSWMVFVDKFPPGGPYIIQIKGSQSTNAYTIKNVLFGDVWVCSGQSNMWLPFKYNQQLKTRYSKELETDTNSQIRVLWANTDVSFKPINNIRNTKGWKETNSNNLPEFSVVAYFFAKYLYNQYKIPIGLITASVGGTPIESWMPTANVGAFGSNQQIFNSLYNTYKDTLEKKGYLYIQQKDSVFLVRQPSMLYNALIAPLQNLHIKGVIWYQGESNTQNANEYNDLFTSLINGWRLAWQQKNLPFLFVQLPNYKPKSNTNSWVTLRKAQLQVVQNVKNCGMAVTVDVGDSTDIHPAQKKEVGERLALQAIKKVYGQNIIEQAPIHLQSKIINDTVLVTFSSKQQQFLVAKTNTLPYFEVAAANNIFFPATASLQANGMAIKVYSTQVKNPIFVRYAWKDNPFNPPLFNNVGLPLSPFLLPQ